MRMVQSKPTPERIYEPNIVHNPFTWMGIWTPQGWRVHKKRWGRAERVTVALSGDGETTYFPNVLRDPDSGQVGWQDDLHLKDDSFTDGGIYPCDPRVEYPIGRPRWAISHTLIYYPVADHNLYTHEYTWDMEHGHLQTHFRRHIELEEARTDSKDGKTVRVRNTPISRTIEGNVHYPLMNSAVRGVWSSPDKAGPNLYAQRIVQLITMHNGIYAKSPMTPVVQCYGMYAVMPDDPTDESLFDPETGLCVDRERLMEQLLIPLDEPKIGMVLPLMRYVKSRLYECEMCMVREGLHTVGEPQLADLRGRLGTRFISGLVGYGHANVADSDSEGYDGYSPMFDLNDDGVIDEADLALFETHFGRQVRPNLYWNAYFGGDWLSTSICLDTEHRRGSKAIADYAYGGGYDADSGVIHLLETPGPDQPVWVEYHHDAPAEAGENNIRIHLYREID